jgi:hypothetical protein
MVEEVTFEEFKAVQQAQGGVNPSQMVLARVYVETQDYIYKIYQQNDRYYVETGNPGLRDGAVVGISSQDPENGHVLEDWIGKNCVLNLTTPYGYVIITRKVQGCTFEGITDGGETFSLELWN